MKPMRPRHQSILDFAVAFDAEHGRVPSYTEIAAGLGLYSPTKFPNSYRVTISQAFADLAKRGLVTIKDRARHGDRRAPLIVITKSAGATATQPQPSGKSPRDVIAPDCVSGGI